MALLPVIDVRGSVTLHLLLVHIFSYLSRIEGSQGELIGWDMSRRPCVRPCVHTFKHHYLLDNVADCNQILYETSLG